MTAYYNEIDPDAADRLEDLIAADLIAAGVVDRRSIEDVRPSDLEGFAQCHFFAGFGIWSLALRRAGWPDDRSVWTGSCPCQPFSQAGEGAGFDDERHLWPHFQWLISQRRPAVIYGEQVASKDAEPWLDLVRDDLEGMAYAFAAVAFPSAGVGAPHIRDRAYWLANAHGGTGAQRGSFLRGRADGSHAQARPGSRRRRMSDGLADSNRSEREAREFLAGSPSEGGEGGVDVVLGCVPGQLGDAERAGLAFGERQSGVSCGASGAGAGQTSERASLHAAAGTGPTNGLWRVADWLLCRDGRLRPVEPGTFPLAHGLPRGMGSMQPELRRLAALAGLDQRSLARAKAFRVDGLRGYGNAIHAEAARVFIEATM